MITVAFLACLSTLHSKYFVQVASGRVSSASYRNRKADVVESARDASYDLDHSSTATYYICSTLFVLRGLNIFSNSFS